MSGYCTRADLYLYGLPRGALGSSSRTVASSAAATDTIELDAHGFETDDAITFRVPEGGVLSAPLVAGTTYYAIRLDDSHFKVSATLSGSAIDLTTDGDQMLVAIALPIDAVIEFYSRWADTFMPAHAVPFTSPIPVLVRGLVAELSAKRLMALAGHSSASMNEAELSAKAQLERFATGITLRDATATSPTNTAAVTSWVASTPDPRGWPSGVLP